MSADTSDSLPQAATGATKANSANSEPLRIAGFGACMISGYPHGSGGLFEVACKLVEEKTSRQVQSTVVGLGGFPVNRAQKYLKPKLFGFKPDYIVIQFGATDAGSYLTALPGGPSPR